MKNSIIVILLATLVSGCAQRIWVNESVTHAQAQKDFAECQYDAAKHSFVPMSAFVDPISSGMQQGLRENELMSYCMTAKGYVLRAKE